MQNANIAIGKPVRAYRCKEHGAIIYGRGPLFIEELSKRIGSATGSWHSYRRDER